ncbi:MAG: hypothetical protein NVSMB27_37800 [Ktedonobacteraceae bacterium]
MEQAKAQSEQELKRLLGNPTPVPGTAPTGAPFTPAPKVFPDTRQSASGHARVERAAARDSLGDQVQTATTLKCTFSGMVPIEARRFLDGGTHLLNAPIVPVPAHSLRTTEFSGLNLTTGAKRVRSQRSHDGPGLKWPGGVVRG